MPTQDEAPLEKFSSLLTSKLGRYNLSVYQVERLSEEVPHGSFLPKEDFISN
jgi:hypothetical protein